MGVPQQMCTSIPLGTSQYQTSIKTEIDHARLGMVNLRLADAVALLRIRGIKNKSWGHRGLAWQALERLP